MEDLTQLTEEQQKLILDFWNSTPNNPPSIAEITKYLFNEEIDSRTKTGRTIKAFLANRSLRPRLVGYIPCDLELTDEQKQYIINNAATMHGLDMAKILFNDQSLSNLDSETRLINKFIKTLDTRVVLNGGEDAANISEGDYEPPKTMDKVLRRVNFFVNLNFDKDKLTPQQKKGLEALIVYLHTHRFIKQMNSYDSDRDRTSLEDAFIRYTFDKPDLTQEEVDQYIVLANEVVISFKAQGRSERLQVALENITNNNPEDAKISMSLVEAISKAQTEYHQCIQRQEKLLDNLKEKRSSRLSKKLKDNASILNLFQEWKTEERRKEYLAMAEREQEAISREVDKLATMEEIKARIFGLVKDEIKYG